MLRVAFVGALSSSFADRVRAHLATPCEFIHTDERNAGDVLPEVDVLVTLVFTREMGAAAKRLRLIQVPGAGLDRIDRSAMPPGSSLAKVHGHEAGIAEYVLGAMIALSREFDRVHTSLRAGRWDSPRRTAAARVARARRPDAQHPWLRRHRPGGSPARPRVRHAGVRDSAQRGAVGG